MIKRWCCGSVVVAALACRYPGAAGDAAVDASAGDVAQDVGVQDGGADDVAPDASTAICGMGLGVCDPVLGTGCGERQQCVFGVTPSGGVACNLAGTGALGDTCTRPDDCGAGLQCLGNRCIRLCCSRIDDAPCRSGAGASPTSACGVSIVVGDAGAPLRACTVAGACDWLTQRGCTANQTCLPTSVLGESRCAIAGTGLLGETCDPTGPSCAAGLVCVAPSGSPTAYRCARICDPRLMDCAGGRICRTAHGYPENFGTCI